MQLKLESNTAKYQIKSYDPGYITVNEDRLDHSIIIMANLLKPWPIRDLQELKESDIIALIELRPKLIIFGSGTKVQSLDPKFSALIIQQGIGVEVMTTAAACRTFAILMAEQRQAVAALVV